MLYSLLATILQEMVSQWFSLRSRNLMKTIRGMLDGKKPRNSFSLVNIPWDCLTGLSNYFSPMSEGSLMKAFYDDPLINTLGENRSNARPSYISPKDFSQVMINILRGDGFDHTANPMNRIRENLLNGKIGSVVLSPSTIRYLKQLYINSNGDINKFQIFLETWFNSVMDRSIGWYKKQTQKILFCLGFALAVIFNIDSIAISKILINSKTAREQLADFATSRASVYGGMVQGNVASQQEENASKNDTITQKEIRALKTDAKAVNLILGLGYDFDKVKNNCKQGILDTLAKFSKAKKLDQRTIQMLQKQSSGCSIIVQLPQESKPMIRFLGWLITGLAISLGAAFWFDLLNKFINLRAAGVKEAASNPPSNPSEEIISRVG
ncbi:hypothetical protein [Pedobacter ginsenosidimutans]|uniref:hypothetical protein n=1 Tax=Pedobacter ginsenosidimutans TaxID=687842 RepID=UPI001428A0A2|nr:hypothetical protein [Pedobacter ginsenosidimutans]